MIPVDQTRLYDPSNQVPPGNCFMACVASIAEIELKDVPDEADYWEPGMDPHVSWRKFWKAFGAWLSSLGWGYLDVESFFDASTLLGVPLIMSGPSPRDPDILHSTVQEYYRIDDRTIGPRMLHDPHSSRDGLHNNEIKTVGILLTSTTCG